VKNSSDNRPHVVIVGGGFGGLYAARGLARQPVRITLIDQNNYHLFQPLLYQVATAALSPGDIATPIRSIFRHQKNARVLMARAESIDLRARRVQTRGGTIDYDYLIIATGATSTYFGNDHWRPFAPTLKTIDDALDIRRRILSVYEEAECERDPEARRALLTFVIVGGGATGVELAGTIMEIARHTLHSEFRSFNPEQTRVILLQSNEHVLPEYPEDLSISARRQLEQMGVEVQTGKRVTDVNANSVQVGDETIQAHTILWTAGVAASPLAKTLGVPLDKGGQVIVDPDLSIPGFPEAFVVGDLASLKQDGRPLPGVAQVAIQGGQAAACNIGRSIKKQPRQPFVYYDKGTMATIGRAAAVANLKYVHLSGLPAWLSWLVIHLFFLIGFENRVMVMWSWIWSYLTFQRGARLITGYSSVVGAPAGTLPTGALTTDPGIPVAPAPVHVPSQNDGNVNAAPQESVEAKAMHIGTTAPS
jgi:NADH dehydrogenase